MLFLVHHENIRDLDYIDLVFVPPFCNSVCLSALGIYWGPAFYPIRWVPAFVPSFLTFKIQNSKISVYVFPKTQKITHPMESPIFFSLSPTFLFFCELPGEREEKKEGEKHHKKWSQRLPTTPKASARNLVGPNQITVYSNLFKTRSETTKPSTF